MASPGPSSPGSSSAPGAGPSDEEKILELEADERPVGFVDSHRFSSIMACIVLTNVVLLGLETAMPDASIFGVINNGLLLIYLGELCMRLLTHGARGALSDPLTVLDLFLVVMAFIERVVSERSLARALPCLRLLRVFRLLRTFRCLREARELWLLTTSGSRALISLIWVSIFLFLILWSMATFAKTTVGESGEWAGSMDPSVEHEPFTSFDSQEYFGSVTRSFLTLVQVLTRSQWAGHVARPVVKVYPMTFMFFSAFLFATFYGLLMAIISNVVQESMAAERGLKKAMAALDRHKRRQMGERAAAIFNLIDENGDGDLSLEELREALKIDDLVTILKELQVPVLNAEGILRLFDRSGDGLVSYDELIDGIVSMGDDIQPRDFIKLAIWAWNLVVRAQRLEERLALLVEMTSQLRDKLQGAFESCEQYLRTRTETELRRKALKMIKDSGPSKPPPPEAVMGSRRPKEVKEDDDVDQAAIFMTLARRFLGEAVNPPSPERLKKLKAQIVAEQERKAYRKPTRRRSSLGTDVEEEIPDLEPLRQAAVPHRFDPSVVSAVVCGRGILPPAPPRFEVSKAEAVQAERTYDKYAMMQGPRNEGHGRPTPNPNMKQLRELLS
mmetsp:Transcript_15212/g.31890  ORF Transcript_15212/g.31890 Transcript_15212/m.31890 type:complete len:616 (-) Transcript_15212:150-1997(-)